MPLSLARHLGSRATRRPRLSADAGSGFYSAHQTRLLRIYLAATTFLYLYGVVFSVLLHPGSRANHLGGIVAIGLGLGALAWLAVQPGRTAPATAAAMAATPVVMAFHVAITAEFACLIAPMFLAMYLRAFYPPRLGVALVIVLTVASVVALAVAPFHKLYIDYLIFTIAIVGAAEAFGVLMQALVGAACTDPLTGVLNRAGWEIATTNLLARARSSALTLTVIALDIDHFKKINDSAGHLAGDQHLVSRAESWRTMAPRDAVLARLGGDEFAVCLAEPAGAAPRAVDRFVADIRAYTPGTSIGVASASGADAEIAALLAAADSDLYAAK
ncbi:GGDEF domain-containing protein [Mycobacterium shigaense]|uniref:Sensor domain-containing diguanylate cyclase n=1 Tax=Mycobacterium shigaense TaxID=722731 RepID=A0A1Z4EPP1_9MYCO|nr:GGDEF domain-containing protein [Mycobacterium shigaense]PRI15039.1 GGDEF domain-containing protein [Mycobacterium shigaense]BAX94872.1 sensor domain-containing diguanylate cyclase [Mycobacterium shigaense]